MNKNDEFYTPLYAVIPIEKYITPKSIIWCPFDTEDSEYVKRFLSLGHTVINTHIQNGEDFFKMKTPKCDYIISNPPYSMKYKVIQNLFERNVPFAMLIGIPGLFDSKERFKMFKNHKFEMMYFDKRVAYFQNYQTKETFGSPLFQSAYVCSKILPQQIVFEEIDKKII